MEVVGKSYPKRTFIKYKAKELLRSELDQGESYEPLDEELFFEIATTLFRAQRNHKFAQPCNSREEAVEIASRIAVELAEAYKKIKLQQKSSLVQRLNALL